MHGVAVVGPLPVDGRWMCQRNDYWPFLGEDLSVIACCGMTTLALKCHFCFHFEVIDERMDVLDCFTDLRQLIAR